MEQVSSQAQSKSSLSWWQQKCKNLLINHLGQLTDAGLTIIESKERIQLGDQDAALQGIMEIHDVQTYANIVKGGSIAAAEDYIDAKWSSPDLTQLIRVFAIAQDQVDDLENNASWFSKLQNWLMHFANRNSLQQAKKNIMAHYDLGNELYKRFLDKEMVYSSAIYAHQSQSLEDAQQNKFQLICERLDLKDGDSVVEIGTGWGGLAIYMASNFDCHVTTTTISEQQHAYVKDRVAKLGLENKITLLKEDYRKLDGQYDKLVSIEMIEAVGKEYFHQFFQKCNSLVKSKGKMLIQAITIADQRYESYSNGVDFIQKYIFPGGCLPSVNVMTEQLTKHTQMVTESIHDIGLDYAQTLNEWRIRFLDSWSELKELGYDDKFKRLWLYYLCYCEGAFLERKVSTVHLTARK
jgi:cyclopropane-fatty-acyl-phospholipid synthase